MMKPPRACVSVMESSSCDWAERNTSFADRLQEAREAAADRLEQECRRRAVDGTAEPVFHQGQPVGVRYRQSDLCLLALLRAYRPERFRHPSATDPGDTSSPSTIVHVSYKQMGRAADPS